MDSGTLTPLLKKLENKGYISRNRSKDDERNLIISISEKGENLKKELVIVPEEISKCVDLNFEETKFLYEILYKIINQAESE